MRFIQVFAALCLPLFLSLLPENASAQATIRVPADQTTIQAGIDAARDGDTVLVSPGTYYENLVFNGRSITVASTDGPATTIIDARGSRAVVRFASGDTSVFGGFTLRNGGTAGVVNSDGTVPPIYGGVNINESSPTVRNNIITNSTCNGVVTKGGAATIIGNTISGTHTLAGASFVGCTPIGYGTGVAIIHGHPLLIGNLIENNGDYYGDGGGVLLSEADGTMVRQNIVRNNLSSGLNGDGAIISYNTRSSWIIQNLVYNNDSGSGGITVHVFAINPVNTFDTLVLQNTVVNNRVSAGQIYLSGNLARVAVANNVLSDTIRGRSAIYCLSVGNYSPSIDHNLIYPNISTDPICNVQQNAFGNIVTATQPVYTNAAAGDYSLPITSPAIDAGNISAAQYDSVDIALRPRIANATGKAYALPDMGAHEFPGTPSDSTYIDLTPSFVIGNALPLLLTAKLTATNGTPTGTVDFYTGTGTLMGSSSINGGGEATYTVNTLRSGATPFFAVYSGNGAFKPSISLHIYVNNAAVPAKVATTTALTYSPASPYALAPVSLTAQVTPSSTATLTGTVTFVEGATTLGTAAVDTSGIATLQISLSTPGTHAITATYGGTTTLASSSGTVTISVTINTTASSLAVTPNPAKAWQTIVASSTVTSGTTTVLPTGTVTFNVNANTVASPSLNASRTASASFTLPAGSYTITSAFASSVPGFSGSTNGTSLTVLPDDSRLTLAVNPTTAVRNAPVNFTAQIAAVSSSHVISGLVVFAEGATVLGTAALDGTNRAQLSISTLAPGTHTIVASFSGSTDFNASISNSMTVSINPQDYTIAGSPNPFTLKTEYHGPLSIHLASIGAFADVVELSCVNLPAHASCSFSNGSPLLPANGSVDTIVMIDTSDVIGFKSSLEWQRGIVLASLLPVGLLAIFRRKRKFSAAALLLFLVCITGCSGKYPDHTTPGTYNIQIAGHGRSTNQNRTASITFVVTP